MEKISKGEKSTIQELENNSKKAKALLMLHSFTGSDRQPPSSPEEVTGPHGMPLLRLPTSWLTCRHVCGSAFITK